ncbi:MFS transporter [Streptomyces sp. NBC_00057]
MHFLPTGQRLPPAVWLLIAARAVNRLGAFSLPFLAVLVTTRFGASTATAGLTSAAFGLATIPSRLAGGHLADRLGRRRTIVAGLTGCTVAQLGIATADSLAAAIGFAVLLGFVFELYEPPSQAMIADAVGATERVRAYSLLNAALAVAGMAAGLIAAGLGRWDLRWLFVVDAVTCLTCAIVVRIALPADQPRGKRTPQEGKSVAPWKDRGLITLLASGTVFALVYLQIMITLPLSLADRGMQPADAGLLLTTSAVTVVAGQPLLRLKRLSTLSSPAAFTAGYALMSLGLAGYAMAHTLEAFLASTVVWSLGDLLLIGRAYAVVAGLAPPGGTGRYMAVYGTSWGIAGVTAPLVGTQLLQHSGATALWTTMAAVCLALAAAQPVLARTAAFRATCPASAPHPRSQNTPMR